MRTIVTSDLQMEISLIINKKRDELAIRPTLVKRVNLMCSQD